LTVTIQANNYKFDCYYSCKQIQIGLVTILANTNLTYYPSTQIQIWLLLSKQKKIKIYYAQVFIDATDTLDLNDYLNNKYQYKINNFKWDNVDLYYANIN
jgi:hypothetical protein